MTAPEYGKPLTRSELAVLERVAAGRGNPGAAQDLWVTVDTVKSHVRHAFRKLGATDRSHLVALAFQAGYLWVGADGDVHAGQPTSHPAAA